MTVELRPLGVHCNIACQYCYQNPQRSAARAAHYDMGRMKQALEEEGTDFRLLAESRCFCPKMRWRSCGLLVWIDSAPTGFKPTDADQRTAHRAVPQIPGCGGLSCTAGELSDIRGGSLAATREATARTEDAIERLCKAGMPPASS